MSYRISVDKAIGITTTVPIEIVYAAGYVPIDLNNIFIVMTTRMHLLIMLKLKDYPEIRVRG